CDMAADCCVVVSAADCVVSVALSPGTGVFIVVALPETLSLWGEGVSGTFLTSIAAAAASAMTQPTTIVTFRARPGLDACAFPSASARDRVNVSDGSCGIARASRCLCASHWGAQVLHESAWSSASRRSLWV